MAPASKLAAVRAKAAQNEVKEKVFHPQSRKAGQAERASLRKTKLAGNSVRRSRKQIEKADRYSFFYHAMPPDVPALTLPEVHEILRDTWLKRHDYELQKEQAARRKGRPRSNREIELSEQIVRDVDEYRAGLDIPDLTHPETVEKLRKWESGDPSYLHLLRFIRVSTTNPELAPIVRHGIQEDLQTEGTSQQDDEMQVDDTAVSSADTPARPASTIQAMDP